MKIISDQKLIITSTEKYYKNLFDNQETELNKPLVEECFTSQSSLKLTEDKQNNIEGHSDIQY